MGCWDQAGFASRTPINEGDKVKVFLLAKDPKARGAEYNQDYTFMAPPFTAHYNDYGSVNDVEACDVTRHLSLFFNGDIKDIIDFVERNSKDCLRTSCKLNKNPWCNRELLESATLVFEHASVFDVMIDTFNERFGWRGSFFRNNLLSSDYVQTTFDLGEDFKSPDGVLYWSCREYLLNAKVDDKVYVIDNDGMAIAEFYERRGIEPYPRLKELMKTGDAGLPVHCDTRALLQPFLGAMANSAMIHLEDQMLDQVSDDVKYMMESMLKVKVEHTADILSIYRNPSYHDVLVDTYKFYQTCMATGLRIGKPYLHEQWMDGLEQIETMIDIYQAAQVKFIQAR